MVDKHEVYHIGTSLNYVGKKVFSINKLEDKLIIINIINYINDIIN